MAIIASNYVQHPEGRQQLNEYQTVALTYVSPLFNQFFSMTRPEQPISTVTVTRVETIQVLQTLTASADPMETLVVQITEVTDSMSLDLVPPELAGTENPVERYLPESSHGNMEHSDHDDLNID